MVEMRTALRAARVKRQLTLRVAAEQIGCSYQTLANWEAGKSVPHPLFAPLIRRFLRRKAGAA